MLREVVGRNITPESVAVAKDLMAMIREQDQDKAKAEFNRAFFNLRAEMPVVYADKEVKTKSGAVAFSYCSPDEIKDTLEPLMKRHGFATMADQRNSDDGKVTIIVTLMHVGGHSVERSYTVRVSGGNSLTTPTQLDAGAGTAAERHCLIKMFGLRTRIKPEDDPRNEGESITEQQAQDLSDRVQATGSDEYAFIKYAGVTVAKGESITAEHYRKIPSNRLSELDTILKRKEKNT